MLSSVAQLLFNLKLSKLIQAGGYRISAAPVTKNPRLEDYIHIFEEKPYNYTGTISHINKSDPSSWRAACEARMKKAAVNTNFGKKLQADRLTMALSRTVSWQSLNAMSFTCWLRLSKTAPADCSTNKRKASQQIERQVRSEGTNMVINAEIIAC